MITIYRFKEELPEGTKYVHDNDLYFDSHTRLDDSYMVRKILKDIDMAKYKTYKDFITRTGSVLAKNYLSTGSKTLLNILKSPNIAFNMIECGYNVMELIPILSRYTENSVVVWRYCAYAYEQNYRCNITYKGVNYTSSDDLMEVMERELIKCV